jgi:predicted  nucleic acid-binding Zn-ribbon protein
MKKIIKALLILLLTAMLCVSSAFAAETYTEGYFYYQVEDHSITITGYFGRDSEVTVPAMIAGDPVNTIGSGAFLNTAAKTIYLPDTIMTIETGAIGQGISVVYDSNTDNAVESGGSAVLPEESQPTESASSEIQTQESATPESQAPASQTTEPASEESQNPVSAQSESETPESETAESETAESESPKLEEMEVTDLGDEEATPATVPGIATPNGTVTVNEQAQLVQVSTDGTVTVLDQRQTYTAAQQDDGTVTITNAQGEAVTVDEVGQVILPDGTICNPTEEESEPETSADTSLEIEGDGRWDRNAAARAGVGAVIIAACICFLVWRLNRLDEQKEHEQK